MSKIRRFFNKILIRKIVSLMCSIYNDCDMVTLSLESRFWIEILE